MAAKLLLIDDDPEICKITQRILDSKGFRVEIAHDAVTGLEKACMFQPDAVLLDLMLPDVDGWQVCRRLKEVTDVPIIMLTALSSSDHVVSGLELGADDYIVKPVRFDELAARIRAVLRRFPDSQQKRDPESILILDQLVIDLEKRQVTIGGERIEFSPTEFRLLTVLARHSGHILPHDFILREVWGSEYEGEIDRLRTYIGYLRRKLENTPSRANYIQSEWGIGYQFG